MQTKETYNEVVPLADRVSALEGAQDSQQRTLWYNPTDKPAVLELHVATPVPTYPRKPKGYEERTGKQKWVIEPKQTRALPSEFDMAIQHTQCHNVDCLQRPFYCRSNEEGHEKQIVGGLGPQLQNKGTQRVAIKPGFITLHPSLDDVAARAKLAKEEAFAAWEKMQMEQAALQKAQEAEAAAAKQLADRAATPTTAEPKGKK